MKLKFLNKFTLPNGNEYYLSNLSNHDYQVLIKYCEVGNKKMFFDSLDFLISENIPNFKSFDIIEKAYTYLVFCFYNIKSEIHVANEKLAMASQEIPLTTIIDNIEENYKANDFILNVDKNVSFYCENPKAFSIKGEEIDIDYVSGLYKMLYKEKEVPLDFEKIHSLKKSFPTQMIKLEKMVRKTKMEADIFRGVPLNSHKINLLSPEIFELTFQIFNDSQTNFYEMMYTAIEYLKISYTDFLKMTPIEVSIILNRFIRDKKEQEEKIKNSPTH